MNRKFRISISAFLALGIVAANAQEPIDQENLVEQLRYAQTRYAALNEIRAMPSESVGPAIQ
jgi:hypothetical protein